MNVARLLLIIAAVNLAFLLTEVSVNVFMSAVF
jgi:hypothetical protein